jgi:hypothetical protein
VGTKGVLCFIYSFCSKYFLQVTLQIAAEVHAAVHIKTGRYFNQQSTTKYTKAANQRFYLSVTCFGLNGTYRGNLHDITVAAVRSLKDLQIYVCIM